MSQTVKARKPGKCRYCGQVHVFIKEKCPAWGKVCSACGGRNHFHNVCKRQSASHKKMKPKVNKVEDISEPLVSGDESGSSSEWVNGVTDNFLHERAVKCKMLIDGKAVSFQIDTGATCNLLPVRYASNITAYGGTLTMWNNAVTHPVGKCCLKLVNPRTGKRYSVEFIVCDDDCKPLLGFRASQQMGIVTIQEDQFERVASVNIETYSEVFDGKLGLLPGLQTLKVNPEAMPRIMANRRVSVNLRPALKNELDRMEREGVISQVSEPTPWLSQLVMTRKKDGSVRVCIDPHELNKALQREHYMMPIMEDVIHELRDSKVFTKADLSSGYWHVKLDDTSSMLTTFMTPFGRYRWLRLPFGLSVSAEIFQKKTSSCSGGFAWCNMYCR